MLTVDFARFPVGPGDRVLDLGCGGGRHSFEAYRRGADVVAFDRSAEDLGEVSALLAAMGAEGEAPPGTRAASVRGDALGLPFADGAFDRVIAAEIFEHIPADSLGLSELVRVLRPGGLTAVTVPRWLPERVCWSLSRAYQHEEGGHVRIYTRGELAAKLRQAGLEPFGTHTAHALHAPYWWLRCAIGLNRDAALPRLYHRVLVWDLLRRPWPTRIAEQALNPLIGKSLVVYARKPAAAEVSGVAA